MPARRTQQPPSPALSTRSSRSNGNTPAPARSSRAAAGPPVSGTTRGHGRTKRKQVEQDDDTMEGLDDRMEDSDVGEGTTWEAEIARATSQSAARRSTNTTASSARATQQQRARAQKEDERVAKKLKPYMQQGTSVKGDQELLSQSQMQPQPQTQLARAQTQRPVSSSSSASSAASTSSGLAAPAVIVDRISTSSSVRQYASSTHDQPNPTPPASAGLLSPMTGQLRRPPGPSGAAPLTATSSSSTATDSGGTASQLVDVIRRSVSPNPSPVNYLLRPGQVAGEAVNVPASFSALGNAINNANIQAPRSNGQANGHSSAYDQSARHVNKDGGGPTDRSGMINHGTSNLSANISGDTSGYSYRDEESQVRRLEAEAKARLQRESHGRTLGPSSTMNGANRSHKPRASIDGGSRVSQKRKDEHPYRPSDNRDSDESEEEGGTGLGPGGALNGRINSRGLRTEERYGTAQSSTQTAGSRMRHQRVSARPVRYNEDQDVETDEGIVGSEEDEQERRERDMSKAPLANGTHEKMPSSAPPPSAYRFDRPVSAPPSRTAASQRHPGTHPKEGALSKINIVVDDLSWAILSALRGRKYDDLDVSTGPGRSRNDRAQRLKSCMKAILIGLTLTGAYGLTRAIFGRSNSIDPAPGTMPVPRYDMPDLPPSSLEELVERLTGLEQAISAIGSDNAVLQQGQREDSDRLRRLESAIPDVDARLQDQIGRLDRLEIDHSKATKTANEITDKLAARLAQMERDIHGLPDSVRSVMERQDKSEAAIKVIQDRLEGVEREIKEVFADGRLSEALQRVLPAYLPFKSTRKGMEIDPTFWVELKKVLIGRDEMGETVRAVLKQEMAAGSLSAGSKGASDKGKGKAGATIKEIDWEKLEHWKQSLLDKMADTSSPAIRKEDFTALFEENALGLRGAIDDLRGLVAASNANKDKQGSSVTSRSGGQVMYNLNTKEDITFSLSSLIDAALLKYSKDTIARPDYALYSAGARVLGQITTPTLVLHRPGVLARTVMGQKDVEALSPAHALMPGNTPGQCWSFKGQAGQLGVMLRDRIVVGDLTLEHAPRETVGDVGAAPREVEVWGLVEDKEDLQKVEEYYQHNPLPENATMPPSSDYLLLSTFEYDVNAPNYIQTFPVPRSITELGIKMGVVIWKFKSNWGAEDYTCLYRALSDE